MELRNAVARKIHVEPVGHYTLNPKVYKVFEQSEEQHQLSLLNKTVREKLGEDFALKTYYGEEVLNISEETFDALAVCYKTVFNESLGESWTNASAKSEIKDSLRWDPDRIHLLSLLYKGYDIIGICLVSLRDREAQSRERDIHWELS